LTADFLTGAQQDAGTFTAWHGAPAGMQATHVAGARLRVCVVAVVSSGERQPRHQYTQGWLAALSGEGMGEGRGPWRRVSQHELPARTYERQHGALPCLALYTSSLYTT